MLVFASVLIWGTVVTWMQIAGYTIATVGLVYYSLGAQTIHAFFNGQMGSLKLDENPMAARRRRKRVCVLLLVLFLILFAATGGVLAGYGMDLGRIDPRFYWYSKDRLKVERRLTKVID